MVSSFVFALASNTVTVLAGTVLLGATAGAIGTWSVLRRRALIGDVLSHSALPGLCAAFWLGCVLGDSGWWPFAPLNYGVLAVGALISGTLSVMLISFLTRATRTKEDAAMVVSLSLFYGLGGVFLSLINKSGLASRASGLSGYLFGQAAWLTDDDVRWIFGVGVVVIGIMLTLYKEFQMLIFDGDFGRTLGRPTLLLDLILMGCVAATAVIGLKAVGVLLAPAMLIVPAAAARFWTDRLRTHLLCATAFGAIAAGGGTLLSSGELGRLDFLGSNLPTGPCIVLCGAAIFLASLAFAPEKGVVAKRRRRTRLCAALVSRHDKVDPHEALR
ncbi:MAG: metal ABC transporter permease [Pirellulales bacterium]